MAPPLIHPAQDSLNRLNNLLQRLRLPAATFNTTVIRSYHVKLSLPPELNDLFTGDGSGGGGLRNFTFGAKRLDELCRKGRKGADAGRVKRGLAGEVCEILEMIEGAELAGFSGGGKRPSKGKAKARRGGEAAEVEQRQLGSRQRGCDVGNQKSRKQQAATKRIPAAEDAEDEFANISEIDMLGNCSDDDTSDGGSSGLFVTPNASDHEDFGDDEVEAGLVSRHVPDDYENTYNPTEGDQERDSAVGISNVGDYHDDHYVYQQQEDKAVVPIATLRRPSMVPSFTQNKDQRKLAAIRRKIQQKTELALNKRRRIQAKSRVTHVAGGGGRVSEVGCESDM